MRQQATKCISFLINWWEKNTILFLLYYSMLTFNFVRQQNNIYYTHVIPSSTLWGPELERIKQDKSLLKHHNRQFKQRFDSQAPDVPYFSHNKRIFSLQEIQEYNCRCLWTHSWILILHKIITLLNMLLIMFKIHNVYIMYTAVIGVIM